MTALPRRVFALFPLALLLLAPGCASTRRAPPAAPPPQAGLLGDWKGTWLSHANGHTGALTCRVSAEPDGRHRFDFRATFWKILHASYSVHLDVKETPAGHELSGAQTIGGFMGGLYTYRGTASNGVLRATYRSEMDHGVFDLARPGE